MARYRKPRGGGPKPKPREELNPTNPKPIKPLSVDVQRVTAEADNKPVEPDPSLLEQAPDIEMQSVESAPVEPRVSDELVAPSSVDTEFDDVTAADVPDDSFDQIIAPQVSGVDNLATPDVADVQPVEPSIVQPASLADAPDAYDMAGDVNVVEPSTVNASDIAVSLNEVGGSDVVEPQVSEVKGEAPDVQLADVAGDVTEPELASVSGANIADPKTTDVAGEVDVIEPATVAASDISYQFSEVRGGDAPQVKTDEPVGSSHNPTGNNDPVAPSESSDMTELKTKVDGIANDLQRLIGMIIAQQSDPDSQTLRLTR